MSKYVSNRHENGPRRVLRGPFYLVAGTGFEPATSGYELTSRRLNSLRGSHARRSRPITRRSHTAASLPISAVSPRFVHKSVHNTARSKCSNRRLRAVTPELGYPDKPVPEWPEVSDPLLTDLTPMRSSPQPTAFNLRRMCCRSLRGLDGLFHEGLTWRGAPNGHPLVLREAHLHPEWLTHGRAPATAPRSGHPPHVVLQGACDHVLAQTFCRIHFQRLSRSSWNLRWRSLT